MTATYEMTSPLGFETKTCSRCGGSGQYSYNQIDGSRCYGCNGQKFQYTKRGKAAKLFYLDSLNIMPADVKVGQRIETLGGNKYTVAEIVGLEKSGSRALPDGSWEPLMQMVFISAQGTRFSVSDGYPVKLVPFGEEKERLVSAALAYQASLTKTGQPRKG